MNMLRLEQVVLMVLALLPALVIADENGMDMSMDGAMDLASGTMRPYLHFTTGDILWFQGWVPQSAGAMIGACIGLFLLALVDRWIAACRTLMETHWRKQTHIILSNRINAQRPAYDTKASTSSITKADGVVAEPTLKKESPTSRFERLSMPFIPSHDIPRGILHAGQAALEFSFMLVVMTYQLGFIISIVVGLGVGETLFGRYNTHAHLY